MSDVENDARQTCGGSTASATSASTVRPYQSIAQLAEVTPWTVDAIQKMVARGIFKLGVHYFKPLGRKRGLIFKWPAIVAMIEQQPFIVQELDAPARQSRLAGRIDVEQATANFERLLG